MKCLHLTDSINPDARGIAAEPPSAKREGDGADSPTRATEGGEAARPQIVLRTI